MMAMRLSDSELAARVRAGNRQRAQRQQERRRSAGLAQLNVWLPQSTRTALDKVAAHRNLTVSETVADLLERALAAAILLIDATTTPATNPTAAETTLDMFHSAPATTTDKDALMVEVGKLLNEGHTGNEIARQLNASGQRTASGAAFTGQNILRDYRAWTKKTGAASELQPT